MVGPVFGGIGGRLNRQATPVASVADIQRAITKALHDDRPCVLTMSANIAQTSTLTLPGGLRAFSIDGGGRWSFTLSGTIATAFNVLGAQGNNGFPVEFSNLTIKLEAGATVANLFSLSQYDEFKATESTRSTTLQSVAVDASASGASLGSVLSQGNYTASLDRPATAIVDTMTISGAVSSLFSSYDSFASWLYCVASNVFVNTTSSLSLFLGSGSLRARFTTVKGTATLSITDNSVVSISDSSITSITNSSAFGDGVVTISRTAGTRSIGYDDVDLDNLWQTGAVTLNSAAPTLTPGAARYIRVTHGASASGIVTISGTGARDGWPIILRFVTVAGTAVYTDGSGNLRLTANFTPTSDDTLTIAYDSTTGLWYEVARSVN